MNTTLLAALALGGAALSVKKPTQNHNLMRLPSFRGIAEVRASLPGRMRLYLPAVSANREAAAEMKRQLEATGVVHEVALNFRLSTALIRYDETKVEAAVVQGAVLKLMGLTDALQKEPVSRIQSGLNTLMAAINHGLLEATNGLLDVRTLAGCTARAGHPAPRYAALREGKSLSSCVLLLFRFLLQQEIGRAHV